MDLDDTDERILAELRGRACIVATFAEITLIINVTYQQEGRALSCSGGEPLLSRRPTLLPRAGVNKGLSPRYRPQSRRSLEHSRERLMQIFVTA